MWMAAGKTGGKNRDGVIWVEAAQRGSPALPTQWRALYNMLYTSSSTGQRSVGQNKGSVPGKPSKHMTTRHSCRWQPVRRCSA